MDSHLLGLHYLHYLHYEVTVISVLVVTTFLVVIAFIAARARRRRRELGSYRLVSLLGQGGMGEVWRAEHRTLRRQAAIKLICPEALGEGGAEALLRRFEREAQATARLDSDHTIQIHDFGAAKDGSLYYVMELLDGMDMDELIDRHGPLPPERVVFLLEQICDSLAEVHQNGLAHRDIKPANIYVCRRGVRFDQVKVLDFGLVAEIQNPPPDSAVDPEKLVLAEGEISGTPAFMAPELIVSSEVSDPRVDIYSLGCVAYWLLTGEKVFERESSLQILAAHLNAEPEPLSKRVPHPIPPPLEDLVLSCLEKDPDRRPQTVQHITEMLSAIDLEAPWDQGHARAWWRGKIPHPASTATTAAAAATAVDSPKKLQLNRRRRAASCALGALSRRGCLVSSATARYRTVRKRCKAATDFRLAPVRMEDIA